MPIVAPPQVNVKSLCTLSPAGFFAVTFTTPGTLSAGLITALSVVAVRYCVFVRRPRQRSGSRPVDIGAGARHRQIGTRNRNRRGWRDAGQRRSHTGDLHAIAVVEVRRRVLHVVLDVGGRRLPWRRLAAVGRRVEDDLGDVLGCRDRSRREAGSHVAGELGIGCRRRPLRHRHRRPWSLLLLSPFHPPVIDTRLGEPTRQ